MKIANMRKASKKLLSLCLAAVMLFTLSISTLAAESIIITADGSAVKFTDTTPVRQNGVIMVPLRATFEAMGANVGWIQAENSATVTLGEQTAKLVIGSDTVTVNGKQVKLPVKTYTTNGRTMIPLTAFAEALGCVAVNETTINSYILKAKSLINSFTTGDTSVAAATLTENYIQHNLAFGTGRDAFIAAVKGLAAAPTATTVKNIRAFQDGNYVFLHTIYNFAGSGEQVAFDIFRFENGKIAEHWDNLDALAAPNPSGHTQTDGPVVATDLNKTAANKALVENFVRDILMGENLDKLTSYYNGDNYIQHNTAIADGLSGLGAALEEMAANGIAMVYDEIHLIVGQGNFVLVASEGSFAGVPTTYYDLFRVENGYIAEHWDVMETLMPESDWANKNGKFGNNIDMALSLINSFTTGDTSVAAAVLTENYIQHNLAFGTGRDAFIAAVKGLAAAPTATTVKNVRAFQDGDYVFLHNIYNFAGAGEQVAFDIFRFENGKIAEHWDNLDTLAAPNPSGHTQTDGSTKTIDLAKTQANKALVESFVRDILMGENLDKLTSYYDGDKYIQHNTAIADGLSGLGAALEEMASNGIAMVYDEIHLIVGQGNFVLIASEGSFAGVPTTYYDLFRVENGYIAEHWDVMETLMPESDWANTNGKF